MSSIEVFFDLAQPGGVPPPPMKSPDKCYGLLYSEPATISGGRPGIGGPGTLSGLRGIASVVPLPSDSEPGTVLVGWTLNLASRCSASRDFVRGEADAG